VETTDEALLAVCFYKSFLPIECEVARGAKRVLGGGVERVLTSGAIGEALIVLVGGSMTVLGVKELL
jgi:hypothetical protein